jgi:tetratricopeptide (TPR) repeat protein
MEASAYSTLSLQHWYGGDWTVALDEINKALDIADRLGFVNDYIIFGEVHRAISLINMGDLEKAELYLEASRAKESPRPSQQIYFNQAFGELRLGQGRINDAKGHFERCLKAIKEEPDTEWAEWYIEPLLDLTLVCVELGQLEEARETAELAKRLSDRYSWDTYGPAMALQAEAAVLRAEGNQEGAEEAYVKCLALWEKAGWPYYKAKALVAYSDAISETNPEESRKRLQQAAEIFERLGAKRDLEKARAKLS